MKIGLPFILLLFLFYLIRKNKKMNANPYNFDPTDPNYIQSQFDVIKNDFSQNVLELIEKIYRLETANFTSGQYRQSLSAGMVYSVDNKISQWNLEGYDVIGFTNCFQVGGKCFRYVQFGSLAEGLRFLGNYIERHGNALRWYSTNPTMQNQYAQKLNGITPRYV